MKLLICGHRPYKFPPQVFGEVKRDIRERLEILASQDEFELELNCGMALGTDIFAAKVASQLSIPFVAYVPFVGFDSKWTPDQQAELATLLDKAKFVHIIEKKPSKQAFILRDKAMVEDSDQVIAYLISHDSGTGHTVKFAHELHKPVKVIEPNGLLLK